MTNRYKRKIEPMVSELLLADMKDLTKIKTTFKSIVKEIFDEECIVYIDKITESKLLVETHFADYNFYEIELGDIYIRDDIVDKIMNDLIIERLTDKRNPNTNRNNERYFKRLKRYLAE